MSRTVALLLMLMVAVGAGTADADDVLRVGVLVPLTGDSAASYGEPVRQGVELAAKLNPSDRIKLVFEDSQCTPKVAVTAAKKLINTDRVDAIIGDVCWTDVIARVTEPAKVVVISTGSAQSEVRSAGDFVFRLKTDVSVDSRELARRLFNEAAVKSVGVVCVDDNWGQGIATNFIDEFKKLGGTIAMKNCYLPNETDFRTGLTKLQSMRPDTLVVAAYPPMTGIILRQADQLHVSARKAVYRGGLGPETLELAGPAAEGLMFVEEFDPQESAGAGEFFQKQFQGSYGRSPSLFAAMGFDAYNLLVKATGTCGSKTSCIRDFLYGVEAYQGASGVLSFDANGDVTKVLTFKKLMNGEYVRYQADNGTAKR